MKAIELQKLRDKLEQARDISVISDSCRDCYMIDTKNELINQALASLQAEPCKTCGGSGKVPKRSRKGAPLGEHWGFNYCPDCKAEAGEILKEARVLLKAGANEEQWAFATKLREVLVLIDSQQQELKELRIIASEYERCKADCSPAEMMGELAAKDKRIAELRGALVFYGDHIDSCSVRWTKDNPRWKPCDCGFKQMEGGGK